MTSQPAHRIEAAVGEIPYRLALAGGWIDQPFCSRLNPTPPGSMVVVGVKPTFHWMERSGLATGTRAEIDLDTYIERHCYLLGTSGSGIPDMKAVLRKVESGELDTNISLDAVCGFEGVADALAAVEGRTASGKIMVYPSLPDLGLVRLSEMGERFPSVAAALDDGRWTKAAEQELLRVAGKSGGNS